MTESPEQDPVRPLPRIAAVVEYCGTAYFGWQRQPDTATPGVQNRVEEALSAVADHPINVHCAGRTDTGVHATAQIIHFDSDAKRSAQQWVRGGNANLPADVRLRWAQLTHPEFHARFSALSRRYQYCIDNRPSKPGLFAGLHSWFYRPLDVHLMQQAARQLLGEHDFSAYRAAGCQAKTAHRHVSAVSLSRRGHLIILDITANAFLQHMVRNIAGVLMAIGCGDKPPAWAGEVLRSKDRTQGGITAPPDGLYLVGVDYPGRFGLPDLPPRPF